MASCAWLLTMFMCLPWCVMPAIALILGFCLQMIGVDVLHCWHLGVGRDLGGTALKLMVQDRSYFGPGRQELRLRRAFKSCKAYAVKHGKKLRIAKFTKANLSWKAGRYPELKCKGSDTMIILSWILEQLTEKPLHLPLYPQLVGCIWAIHQVMVTLFLGGVFLTRAEQEQIKICGELFLKSYVALAGTAITAGECLFKCRPKFHMVHHLILACERLSGRNPVLDSTFMDEDAWILFLYFCCGWEGGILLWVTG